MGGLSAVELFEVACKDSAIMHELGVSKFIYYHANPEGVARNSETFMKGEVSAENILLGANRAPEHVDRGFPGKYGGEAKYKGTRQAIRLMEEHSPDVCIPLHNAAIGGGYAYMSSELDKQAAEKLSQFIGL
jgi:hypothetical protein